MSFTWLAISISLLSNPAISSVPEAVELRAQGNMQRRIDASVEAYANRIGIDESYIEFCKSKMLLEEEAAKPASGLIPFNVYYRNIKDIDTLKWIIDARETFERSYITLCLASAKQTLSEAEAK